MLKVTGGAVILNEDVMVNKKKRPWTLGSYLSLLKKSAGAVKLGIRYMIDPAPTEHSSSPSLPSTELIDRSTDSKLGKHTCRDTFSKVHVN